MKRIESILLASIVICIITYIITKQMTTNTIKKVENLNLKYEALYRRNYNEKIYPEILLFDSNKEIISNYSPREKNLYLFEVHKNITMLERAYVNAPKIRQENFLFKVYQTENMARLQGIYDMVGAGTEGVVTDKVYTSFRMQVEQLQGETYETLYKDYIRMIHETYKILNTKK